MCQRLQLIARTMLLLLLLPALVIRPLVMTVEKSFRNGDACPVQMSFCDSQQSVIGDQGHFRSIARENAPISTLTPRYSNAILASSKGRILRFVSNAVSSSPKGFLVLRI
jgi:hypothetical protein